MDLVDVFALFVFMLALLFFGASVFSVNKDLYKPDRMAYLHGRANSADYCTASCVQKPR